MYRCIYWAGSMHTKQHLRQFVFGKYITCKFFQILTQTSGTTVQMYITRDRIQSFIFQIQSLWCVIAEPGRGESRKYSCCCLAKSECFDCVCVCFLPIHSGHQVRWTYQPGSHRRKVTQDFSSTFFLRCVP